MKTIRTVSAAYLRRQSTPIESSSPVSCATCGEPSLGRLCLKCASPGQVLRLWVMLTTTLENPPSAFGMAAEVAEKGSAEQPSQSAVRRRLTPVALLVKGLSVVQREVVRKRYGMTADHIAYEREIAVHEVMDAAEELLGKAPEGRTKVRGIRERLASWVEIGEDLRLDALVVRRQYAAAAYKVSKAQRAWDAQGWLECMRSIARAESGAPTMEEKYADGA